MKEFFSVKQAADIIMVDMEQLDIGFNKAWDNYNNEWFNNSLTEDDKIITMDLVVDRLNKLYGDLRKSTN